MFYTPRRVGGVYHPRLPPLVPNAEQQGWLPAPPPLGQVGRALDSGVNALHQGQEWVDGFGDVALLLLFFLRPFN